MRKNGFLLKLSIAGLIATSLTACGGNSTSSVASNPSSVAPSSSVTSVEATKATGAYSYVNATMAERTKILGNLEQYAASNYLTGLPLYENGGYVMYNPRVVKGTNNYITGYGFSILRDGYLSSPMAAANEPTEAWRTYYHQWDQSDAGSMNALNDKGSQISDMYANISASYWGNKMNSTKDGYEWYGVLSTDDRPIPVADDGTVIANPTSTTLASSWKFHVKVGESGGIKYHTTSKVASRAAFDGTYTKLEDYVEAYKILLTKKNGYFRGGELASKTGADGIVGAAAYYNASGDGYDDAAWQNVGIKSDTTDNSITVTFMAPMTRFNAMYRLASNLYEPIPAEFFDLVGAANYGNYSSDKSLTPIDNILCMGPYEIESWQENKEIVYKRVDDWYEVNNTTYRIPGIHVAILPGYNEDKSIALKEFLKGNLDAAGITQEYLDQYKNDSRTTQVPGDSVFKLNINSCTQAKWEELFGEKGAITQTAKADYWTVKPWMSNTDFLDGLLYSINRKEYAENRGSIPSINYFSTNYMSDPENGVSYDSTPEHAAALKAVFGDTVSTYGYSLEAAKAKFKKAVAALIASGAITEGTEAAPTEISIEVWWMQNYMIKDYGDDFKTYVETAFNDNSVSGGKVKLVVNNKAVDVWSDVYYKHLMVGQFDLGFGSITGNALDPLNFLEVLRSDNSSTFTLNWGPDTSEVTTGDKALVYDNKIWSFNSLWEAAEKGAIVKDGAIVPPVVLTFGTTSKGDDGSLTVTAKYESLMKDAAYAAAVAAGDFKVEIDDVYFYGSYTNAQGATKTFQDTIPDSLGYDAYFTGTVDADTGDITLKLTPDLYAMLGEYEYLAFGVDYTLTISGVSVSGYTEVMGAIPAAA
jgi:hypothetical protein